MPKIMFPAVTDAACGGMRQACHDEIHDNTLAGRYHVFHDTQSGLLILAAVLSVTCR
jgi:hypothetical protein